MRSFLLAAALGLCEVCVSPFAYGAAAPAIENTEARYQTLLAEAKAHAPNVDWGALRLAYSRRRSFKAAGDSAAKRKMFEAAERSDCDAALPAARAVLDLA